MKFNRTLLSRTLASVAIAGSLMASTPLLSQADTTNPTTTENRAARQEQMRDHVKARLQRMSERLHIDASQQDAWNAYANTVEGMVGTGMSKPPADADAATLARFRAQFATEQARKMTQLADATATLQQSLNPEQRQTLNEMAREHGHMGRGTHSR